MAEVTPILPARRGFLTRAAGRNYPWRYVTSRLFPAPPDCSLALVPADESSNLWQSIHRTPAAPGTYRVMLPSGRMIPAAWLNGRWWERNQEIAPVAWQKMGSAPGWPATARGDGPDSSFGTSRSE